MTTYLEKGSGNRYTLTDASSDAARDEELGERAGQTEIEATTAAVRMAAELDVDLTDVEGSGKDGRVTAPDVEAYAEKRDEGGFTGLSTKDL